jgi:hypothetical protein
MEIENLAEKVKIAKDAVKELDEPLKTEAFKKILDKLFEIPRQINSEYNEQDSQKSPRETKKKVKKKSSGKGNVGIAGLKIKEESEKKKRELAEKLNRTEYPEIHNLKGILSQALYILKIMKEKGVKGLTPPEIQFILREVFGIKQSPEAISVALNRKESRKCINRKRTIVGRTVTYIYEIMREGENYLEKKQNNKNNDFDES